jgi:C1A family cysteine protease
MFRRKNKKMKSKNKKAIGIILAVIIAVSVFTVVIPGTASESSNTLVTAEPTEEMGIEELQQWVYDQGYNYTVGENWITALSPEERQKLCGYKPLMPPTEPLPENLNFRSIVGIPELGRGEQPPVGQPPAYDAMALGYVTPVRDQGPCGSCWIFGAIAEFESDVLINESVSNVTLNFSEQEVGDCNIWSRFCNGGNAYMTTNYFTKKGSSDEACHPYAATPQTCQNCPILKNADNWREITDSYGNELYHVNTIKNAILNYGPVYTTINASGPSFSLYDSGVYEWWDFTGFTNHAIEIIGWNDSLLHSHGKGAWLIKNSWGTDWGRNSTYPGCAWVAYGAANIGDYTSAISGYNNASRQIYYHDEYGWMGYGYGYGYPYTIAWGAVRFIPTQNGQLKSVDFWADDVNMQYEIKVFDTISSGASYTFSDPLGTPQTGSTAEMGYYSIPLDTLIPLVTGDDFIVQIKLTTSTT